MRAIIILDSDARALLEQLELETMRLRGHAPNLLGSGMAVADQAKINDLHSSFRYIVVRWLQEHGATVTR